MSKEEHKPNPMWTNLFRRQAPWKQTATDMLLETPIFSGIPRRVVAQLVDTMHRRSYNDDEVIFRKGDPGLGMYLVISGQVSIQLDSSELTGLLPGDFFGEVALLGEEQRTADAVACGDTELVGFFRPDLQEWLDQSPRQGVKVLQQLGQVIAARLRASNERLAGQPL